MLLRPTKSSSAMATAPSTSINGELTASATTERILAENSRRAAARKRVVSHSSMPKVGDQAITRVAHQVIGHVIKYCLHQYGGNQRKGNNCPGIMKMTRYQIFQIDRIAGMRDPQQLHGAPRCFRLQDPVKDGANHRNLECTKQPDQREQHRAGKQLRPVRPDIPHQTNQSAHDLLTDGVPIRRESGECCFDSTPFALLPRKPLASNESELSLNVWGAPFE